MGRIHHDGRRALEATPKFGGGLSLAHAANQAGLIHGFGHGLQVPTGERNNQSLEPTGKEHPGLRGHRHPNQLRPGITQVKAKRSRALGIWEWGPHG